MRVCTKGPDFTYIFNVTLESTGMSYLLHTDTIRRHFLLISPMAHTLYCKNTFANFFRQSCKLPSLVLERLGTRLASYPTGSSKHKSYIGENFYVAKIIFLYMVT